MFYNQPLAIRFGTELLRHVDQVEEIDPFWDTLDIAVAWVRASGMAYLSERLANFLHRGGQLSVIVGIDLQNTTREGLQALLDLERYGRCETFVYHNEAGSIFHPKLYLFRNEEEARLIVGSNNITKSGLYVNVEAGLEVDTTADATVVAQALDALSSWKDTNSRLAVRLDNDFLSSLVRQGYVPDEATAREKLRRERTARPSRDAAPLFASRPFLAPERIRREARRHSSRCSRAGPLSSCNYPIGTSSVAGNCCFDALEKSVCEGPADPNANSVSRCRYFFQRGQRSAERTHWRITRY